MRFRTQCSHYIGLDYINNPEVVNYHKTTLNTTVMIDGIKYAMPRYYRDKIFDDEDKETIRKNAEEAAINYDKWYKEKFIDTGYDTPNRTRSKEVYNDFIKKVKKKVTTSLNSDESLQLNSGKSSEKK